MALPMQVSLSALATISVFVVGGASTIIALAFKYGRWRGKHEKEVEDREESIEKHGEKIPRLEAKVDAVGEKVDSLSENIESMSTRLERNASRLQRQNHTIHDVALSGEETCSDPECEWCHGYRKTSSPVESQTPDDDVQSGD